MSERYDPKKIAKILSDNKVSVSVRGSAVRVSPNVYNTQDDLEALGRMSKEGYLIRTIITDYSIES